MMIWKGRKPAWLLMDEWCLYLRILQVHNAWIAYHGYVLSGSTVWKDWSHVSTSTVMLCGNCF